MTVGIVAHYLPSKATPCPYNRDTSKGHMADFNLTNDDLKLIAETTPEQWAETATEVFKDRNFWLDIRDALVVGFVEGITEAMKAD